MPSEAITLTLAVAAPPGAVSSRPTVRPRVEGLPATTPCSVTGAAPAVNDPIPAPGTSTPATIGTFDVNSSPAADAPSELSVTGVVAAAEACTGALPLSNWVSAPAGVYATTFTFALAAPGTVMNSRAELLATVRPGITTVVEGAAACGSHAPLPALAPSQTEAAIWPELVCTCRATAWAPCT